MLIEDIYKKYSTKIDRLDLDLLIASAVSKPREFVLAHPEYKIPITRSPKLEAWIKRRIKHEPIAYILRQKEFYGLNFKVNRNTLIPRPETELLVEEVIKLDPRNAIIIDVGTGSGNIIISLAKILKGKNRFIAIDTSEKALAIAKQNSRLHKTDRKIKFLKGNLLEPILKHTRYQMPDTRCLVLANLPYLSKNIYSRVSSDIRKYEPKSALLSGKGGLAHYEKLLRQIKKLQRNCFMPHVSCFMEISPEQRNILQKMAKNDFPRAKTSFFRDLAGRWRLCRLFPD